MHMFMPTLELSDVVALLINASRSVSATGTDIDELTIGVPTRLGSREQRRARLGDAHGVSPACVHDQTPHDRFGDRTRVVTRARGSLLGDRRRPPTATSLTFREA